MSSTTTSTSTSPEAASAMLITSIDTYIETARTSITKVEKKLPRAEAAVEKLTADAIKLQDSEKNLRASIQFPEMHADAKKLDEALRKIRFLEWQREQEKAEKERYISKFNAVNLEASRLKTDKKALIKTVAKQQLEMDDIRSEVEQYFKDSAEGRARLEAAHEAYAATLEELLEYKRTDERVAAARLESKSSSSALWSN